MAEVPVDDLGIERVDVDQDKAVLKQVASEVSEILTPNENILYIAHQGWTMLGQKLDAAVATNNRMIIFNRHRFRGFSFTDFLWEDVQDVKIREGMLASYLECRLTSQERHNIKGLIKKQTRILYSICQQKEQEWRERRRVRKMEEERARAGGTQISMPAQELTGSSSSEDPVAKLAKAKEMFDRELISEAEYETLKAEILRKM